MSTQNLAAFGLYMKKSDVDTAIAQLRKGGFAREDISLLAPERSGSADYVYQQRTNLKEGAIIGAIVGFFFFGFVGLSLGLAEYFNFQKDNAGVGVNSWFVFGLIGALVGLFLGAASGALAGIGSPKRAAKRYGFYLKEGGIVLSVHLKDEAERKWANAILEKTGAEDISDLQESQIWDTIVPEKRRLVANPA